MHLNAWALGGGVVMAGATLALGVWGARTARTTSDFRQARRLVRVERNAAAISGEYLSAASFLGVAGLVLKDGVDALWYPVGFAAGYLALMLFVAAPLRRSGAYTLPDFAEARLDSLPVRWLATALVVLIGWLYLVPQLQAAGLVVTAISGAHSAVGIVTVAVLVLVSVLSGGMRAVTLVQAFQYWVKLFAITLPAFALIMVFLYSTPEYRRGLDEKGPPIFERDTTVEVQTPVQLRVTEPVWLEVRGGSGQAVFHDGTVYVQPGEYPVDADTELRFPAGSAVPVVAGVQADNESWMRPQDDGLRGLFETYSLILATFLGTMGLPHVLVRFYTNPSGMAARRTTLYVLALLGTFYLFPAIFGLLSRFFVPELLLTGRTDAAVLLLPVAMLDNWIGSLLGSITAAGAFAALLSTSSGLVVSIAGVLHTDVLRGWVRDIRVVLIGAALVPVLFAMVMPGQDIAQSVSLAFAMAASTFCPLLVLGIWWRGLTAAGAATGLVVGGGLVMIAVLGLAMFGEPTSWWSPLLHQPAAVTVPVAFLVMWAVSHATRRRRPDFVARIMLRMHAPDRLGFIDDRVMEGRGSAGEQPRHSRRRHRYL